ncbi:MAG: hypothetical protein VKS61_09880 [Candidatus Sericytochromatia bacterium]|nr:hypothetical protein [Candidatus Sericytochromatia bacterium]
MFNANDKLQRALLAEGGLRRLGACLATVAALTASACGQAAPRATLVTSPVTSAEQLQQHEQEVHGETHPNNILPFLAATEGGRSLQAVAASAIKPAHELMITDLKVVEDPVRSAPGGAWHFGTLMTRMAGGKNPSQFTRSWLRAWEVDRTVNGDVSPARKAMKQAVTDRWLAASGGASLDLAKAPFRLLAIVNRLDLRTSGNAGEGRLIYGVLDELGNPLPFTVIFEYGIPLANAKVGSVEAWANRWHALAGLPLGSTAYNSTLEAITDTFTGANANPARPNGSALNQLRTNEIALGSSWELREFQVSAKSGLLAQVTVKQSPKESLNNSPELAAFLKANAGAVRAGKHVIPARLLGSRSSTDVGTWRAPGVAEPVRKAFAVATCIGCHQAETSTGFLHVATRRAGEAAGLSRFVQDIELPARSRDLASLVTAPTPTPSPSVAPTPKPKPRPTVKPFGRS